ncbi:hypothetical protein KP509_36G021600 [Ceratopteris richardii]|uniref:Uncharacterized protein n=1 Tax=Ceratopteris richardii TaxID=49495 RepID=A0A8T2QCJ8_CERRI|nr:hypothetical protein KP509_36G021600 [Ceratopteris richardii]
MLISSEQEGLNLVETKATNFMYTEPRSRSIKQTLDKTISTKCVTDVPRLQDDKEEKLAGSRGKGEDTALSKSQGRSEETLLRLQRNSGDEPQRSHGNFEEKLSSSQIKLKDVLSQSQVKSEERLSRLQRNSADKPQRSQQNLEGNLSDSQIKQEEKVPRSHVKTDENQGVTQDTQLKASRDVAMAMATKAKLLLRELKDVKTDLALTKARCTKLEEENKRLRESIGKDENPDVDELVRLQLEALLAEKARLTQENAAYARENQFLHEIVQYHQLKLRSIGFPEETLLFDDEGALGSSSVDMENLPLYPEEKDIIALEESVKISSQNTA